MSDVWKLVGAPQDNSNGTDAGAVYSYRKSGTSTRWDLRGVLWALDPEAGDTFGASIAVEGNTMVIGSRGDDDDGDDSGSAYIFTSSGNNLWGYSAKLKADNGGAGDLFGCSVSINEAEDTVTVGAPGDDDKGANAGATYVFKRNGSTWTLEQKLTDPDGGAGDEMGCAVAISGDTVAAGVPNDDDNGAGAGAVNVFKRVGATWNHEAKVKPDDGAAGDGYGTSVAVSAIYLLGGAPGDDDKGAGSGSAYVHKRTGTAWSQQAKLNDSDGQAGDASGKSVSIDGNNALVGAPGDDDNGSNSGSVTWHQRSAGTWTKVSKLKGSINTEGAEFGSSVGISGLTMSIGAKGENTSEGAGSGSSWTFDFLTADLEIAVASSVDPVRQGENLTYTITVSNNGPTSAKNIKVTDTLPSGTTLVNATPASGSCSGTTTVECDLGTLAKDASVTVTIEATVAVGTGSPLSNTATVASTVNDGVQANNSATVTTSVAAPARVGGVATIYDDAIGSAMSRALMAGLVVAAVALLSAGAWYRSRRRPSR